MSVGGRVYCPGPRKDWEMSLEGKTWGMEVEPSCPNCGPVRLADSRVHPIPNSLE